MDSEESEICLAYDYNEIQHYRCSFRLPLMNFILHYNNYSVHYSALVIVMLLLTTVTNAKNN